MAKQQYARNRRDVAYAIQMGWEFCGFTGGGHMKFRHPAGGPQMIVPATRSDIKGEDKAISWIKRNTPRED